MQSSQKIFPLPSLEAGSLALCAAGWLVVHNPLLAPSPTSDTLLTEVLAVRQEEDLCDAWQRLGAFPTLRAFSRRKYGLFPSQGSQRRSTAELIVEAGEVRWNHMRLGKVDTLFFQALPQEAQLRIAYETFGYRYIRWLERHCGVLLLSDDATVIRLFIPDGAPQPDIAVTWPLFVRRAFSLEELQKTFVLLLNSVLLSERGFSVPAMPIITQDQADILLALFLATLLAGERNIHWREQQLQQLRVDLAELSEASEEESIKEKRKAEEQREQVIAEERSQQERLLTLHARYDPALSRLHSLLTHLRTTDPRRARRLQQLAREYTGRATRQLKVTRDVLSMMMDRIEELLAYAPEISFLPAPILVQGYPPGHLRIASDSAQGVCYGCGSVIPTSHKRRKVEYTANKLVLRAPSQTLQSRPPQRMLGQVQPEVCGRCAVLSLTCPVKLADTGLVVSLREVFNGHTSSSSAVLRQARYLYEQRLQGLAVGELLTTAGRYLMIPCLEQAPDARPLIERMGGREYALLKVASLFPSDVLERFQVEALLGSDPLVLSSRHLLMIRLFLEVFGIHLDAFRTKQAQSKYAALADAIRSVERDQMIFALYRLVVAFLTQPRYSLTQRLRLEDGFTLYQEKLRMDGELTIAQRFRDVAGLTGILYAFISRARKPLQDAAQQSSSSRDPERELKKLIETADHPLHFTYEAAGTLLGQNAQLWRSAQTHFIYDEARRLLEEAPGISLQEREQLPTKEGENSALRFYYDDIREIYTLLYERRYTTEHAQRGFAYELKLSLYTCFPELRPGNLNA
jgi:hypothetical protein